MLGEAAHAVIEAAFRSVGWPDDPAAAAAEIAAAWDAAVEAGMRKLATAWEPAVPPPPEEWPGYQLTKVRTIRRAKRLLATPQSVVGRIPGTGIERTLHDPATGLFGRVDRIDRHGSSFRVVDLKAGIRQSEPTEDQTRQLLLYAVLVHRTFGEWPSEMAIEDPSGQQIAMPLESQRAEAALAEILLAVAQFNRRIETGSPTFEARPDPSTCRWCPFRVVCSQYWRSLRIDWDHRSVMGQIIESGGSERGTFVELRIESPGDAPWQTVRVSSLPRPPSRDAQWFGAVDLQQTVGSREARARWSTRMHYS